DMKDLKGQVKLFGMNTELKLQKQIGNKTEAIGSEQIEMFFDKLKQPTISYYGDSARNTEDFLPTLLRRQMHQKNKHSRL
ncbi:hypothetical protein SB775_33520, partial [Peribacillus sp. SIMBA_075]